MKRRYQAHILTNLKRRLDFPNKCANTIQKLNLYNTLIMNIFKRTLTVHDISQ